MADHHPAPQGSDIPTVTRVDDTPNSIERALFRPPEYGGLEWCALPADDPRRHAALVHAAECWRLLCSSPHLADLLAEWQEWLARRTFSQTSSAISAAADWRGLASAPTYAEIDRRRNTYTTPALTPEQIRARAAQSWAALDTERAAA
jgi:hypothetical protein